MRLILLLTAILVQSTICLGEEKCEEKCKTTCEEDCPEKRVCTADEKDCGTLKIVPTPPEYCDPVKICVDKNCECATKDKNGEDCPVICSVECSEEKGLCTGTTDLRGCKQADYCVAKAKDNDGNLCDAICPVTCQADAIQCSAPNDAKGCTQADTCVAKGKDTNGNDCSGVCPTTCKDDEMKCPGGVENNGCTIKDTCVAKGTDNSGGLCHGICPVECKEGEILCKGSVLENGCKASDACHAKAKDTNGEYCPDKSASHNCQVSCKEGETLCTGHVNQLGCKGEDECKELTKNHEGNFCPATSVCHVTCKVNELSCSGGMDQHGCKKPDVCVPMGRDYKGNLCPAHCPTECKEGEILCSGKVNAEGCKEDDICVKRTEKTVGPDKGDLCSGTCPAECSSSEITCPSQLDCSHCPTEEVCRPKAKDINGVACPDDSASHNCPKICDERNREVVCPTFENNLGCKPAAVCVVKATGKDGNDCPEHSVCDKQCGTGELHCQGGVDSNDCKNPDQCIHRGSDLDGNLCTVECPPICDDTHTLCHGGTKANGCKENAFCVPKAFGNDGAQCVAVCQQNPCPETGIVIAGEPDANNCPTESTCGVPKTFGPWTNSGTCQASGTDPACGPGTQKQTRTCVDGTLDKCIPTEQNRGITCAVAGTELPLCHIPCKGGDSCCASDNKCGEDEGDCDNDDQCKEGLKCGTNNCKESSGFDWDSSDDCCYVPIYKAMDGCSTNNNADHEAGTNPPGYYSGTSEAAEMVCCATDGSSCSRKDLDNQCRSGDDDLKKVTWEVARKHCEAEGMRLCNSQEELNQCCGTGCMYDFNVAWTNKEQVNYIHFPKACVNGNNIVKYSDKTIDECKGMCSADVNCLAFEYGVDYGSETGYQPKDCQLQSSTDKSSCDGSVHNLDLYVKAAQETLIIRQTLPTLFSKGMLKVNQNDPSNANYAILDQMEGFRGSDGKFHFKLKWPGDTTEYEWKQTSNPVTETISGYEGINIPYTGQYWGGLEPGNPVGNYALIDGSVGHPNWFYAIGSFEVWNGGIPAYAKTDSDYDYVKQSVELYVIAG